jgi:multiple sugar transport system permease protein
MYWLLNMSLMFKTEFLAVPTHLYPHDPTISNYSRLFGATAIGPGGAELPVIGQASMIQNGLRNSVIVALIVTVLTMLVSLPVAYALGRLDFRGRTAMLFAIITSRSYPPIAIIIPFVLLYSQIGLQGTTRGLVLIYLTLTIPLVVWVMTGFFASLPRTVEAAARVDGNTRWQAFYRVILPMSWPGIAVTTAICFMVCWNEFAFSQFLAAGSEAQTLPPAIATFFFQISQPTEMAAVSIIAILPPALLAYLFQSRIRNLNLVDPL